MSHHMNSLYRRHDAVNPYQPTTVPIHKYSTKKLYNTSNNLDTGLSDDSFIGSYYGGEQRYQYSDNSSSSRLRFYENDDISVRRFSQNTYSDRSSRQKTDNRRIYPNPLNWDARIYHEIQQPVVLIPAQRSHAVSSHSDRPQSTTNSSGVASAIVDGCGGQCQTIEKFLYFFMQLLLTMLILTGISLVIAGLVLRKSAARNVQVLVYIGILITAVSGVLLKIQWRSWQCKKKRRLAMKNSKRSQIPMENLNRPQQTLISHNSIRVHQLPRMIVDEHHHHQQEGIPWWRRKDVTNV